VEKRSVPRNQVGDADSGRAKGVRVVVNVPAAALNQLCHLVRLPVSWRGRAAHSRRTY
jgi:hypothetical protein